VRVALAAGLAALVILVPPAAGAGASNPVLELGRGGIHGTHFAPRERVRVTFVFASDQVRRTVRVSRAGSFSVATPPRDPCLGALFVTARGSRGDAARLRLPQRMCPPD
jgi:hypothetical protein